MTTIPAQRTSAPPPTSVSTRYADPFLRHHKLAGLARCSALPSAALRRERSAHLCHMDAKLGSNTNSGNMRDGPARPTYSCPCPPVVHAMQLPLPSLLLCASLHRAHTPPSCRPPVQPKCGTSGAPTSCGSCTALRCSKCYCSGCFTGTSDNDLRNLVGTCLVSALLPCIVANRSGVAGTQSHSLLLDRQKRGGL